MTRTLVTVSLGAMLVLAGAAGAQDTAPERPRAERATPDDLSNLDEDDLPAARQLIEDEAQHRDRLARINRLRQLAEESGDRERLQRLDDLERRQLSLHEARRLRARSQMSDEGRANADDFVRRGGVWRARVANRQADRERQASHQQGRERDAQADHQKKRKGEASPPPRGTSRSPSRSPGGRSPR